MSKVEGSQRALLAENARLKAALADLRALLTVVCDDATALRARLETLTGGDR